MSANRKLFKEMSEPFKDADECNAAIHAFFEDLQEIRKKHKITNVYCVLSGSCQYEEDEGEWINSISIGDSLKALTLTAWAYGKEAADHRQLINTIVEKAGKSKVLK